MPVFQINTTSTDGQRKEYWSQTLIDAKPIAPDDDKL